MTETQQRFLRSIADRIPLDHVVELHLFPPIRQGGVETGVAVVAEDPRRAGLLAAADDVSAEQSVVPVAAGDDLSEPDVAVAEIPTDDTMLEDVADEPADLVDSVTTDEGSVGQADGADGAESNGAAHGSHAPNARYTIHTARYRLTLKGVDRGKWEVDVVAEADAPLEAVDAVVRGVQRRAGEGAEPDRLSTEAFREALELTPAQLDR